MTLIDWVHTKCLIPSDVIEQPPVSTNDAANCCHRCGVGATNTNPILLRCIIHEPNVTNEVQEVEKETDSAELERLKQRLAELEAELEQTNK